MTDLSFAVQPARKVDSPIKPALPQREIAALMATYGSGDLAKVARDASALAEHHAPSLELCNILGAACIGLGDHTGAESAASAVVSWSGEPAPICCTYTSRLV